MRRPDCSIDNEVGWLKPIFQSLTNAVRIRIPINAGSINGSTNVIAAGSIKIPSSGQSAGCVLVPRLPRISREESRGSNTEKALDDGSS